MAFYRGEEGSVKFDDAGSSAAATSDETNVFIEAANTATDAGGALFELYLDTSGSKKISFDGVITSASYTASVGEVEVITCNFVTNGAITLDI